jgi:uncharacterized protein with ParB-like and HNH nuclease domain
MPTELQSLAKIFNNRLFRIPDYQRGFAWGERQLADFWSDLLRVGSERTHYYGQLTLEKSQIQLLGRPTKVDLLRLDFIKPNLLLKEFV